jgi:hypothetical protein
MNILIIVLKLSPEIINIIKEFVPRLSFVFTNRENYFLYHHLLNINNYENYIREIEYEIYEKYGKKLNDFPNYYKLYLFLKSVGEVDLFYKNYSKKFIKNYNKFYLKYISLKNNYEYKNFEKKFRKKIKNFKDINILHIIENNISDNFDKKYIKNKFLELTKNNKKL